MSAVLEDLSIDFPRCEAMGGATERSSSKVMTVGDLDRNSEMKREDSGMRGGLESEGADCGGGDKPSETRRGAFNEGNRSEERLGATGGCNGCTGSPGGDCRGCV